MNKLVTVNSNNSIASYDVEVDVDALRESVSGLALFPGEWIKFRKGDWLVGREERKASLTEPFVAHMGEILLGWAKIADGAIDKRIAGRIADKFRVPPRETLGDDDLIGTPDDCWKPMTAIVMRDAEDNVYTFTSLTASGRTAVMNLIDRFLRQCRNFPTRCPAVLLGVSTGRSKKYNAEYPVPVFKIVSWEPWDTKGTADAPTHATRPADTNDVKWENTPPMLAPPIKPDAADMSDAEFEDTIPF